MMKRRGDMISKYRSPFALACSAIALPTLLEMPAHATGATAFAYSPLSCRTFEGEYWLYPTGQIGNVKGNQKMRVFCPLIHEAKFDQTQKIQIHVVNAHPKSKVRCRAFFGHPDGLNAVPTPWDGADDKGVQPSTITLNGHKYLGGSNMLECEIPEKWDDEPGQKNFDGVSRIGSYFSGIDK
jgi:hypothetical protein